MPCLMRALKQMESRYDGHKASKGVTKCSGVPSWPEWCQGTALEPRTCLPSAPTLLGPGYRALAWLRGIRQCSTAPLLTAAVRAHGEGDEECVITWRGIVSSVLYF
jgi:hypothetical protein